MGNYDRALELIQREVQIKTNRGMSVVGQISRALGVTNRRARLILEHFAAESRVDLEYNGRGSIIRVSVALDRELVIGGVYRHCHGLRYRVQSTILDVTGYEQSERVRSAVWYVQLDDGKYPAGTEYVRAVADFLGQVKVSGRMVRTFELEVDGTYC